MYKLNNKGSATFLSLFSIMLITVAITYLFFPKINNSLFLSRNHSSKFDEIIRERNSYERLHSMLVNDPSLYEGEFFFDDLDKTVLVEEVSISYKNITKVGEKNISFNVKNETDIEITINIENEEGDPFYDFYIYYEDEEIKRGESFSDSSQITIPKTKVKSSEERNYGEYRIEVIPTNCDIKTTVNYKEIDERILKINDKIDVKVKSSSVSFGGL